MMPLCSWIARSRLLPLRNSVCGDETRWNGGRALVHENHALGEVLGNKHARRI